MANQIRWTNALSTRPSLEAAVTEVVETVTKIVSGKPDLGIVFISYAYASDYPRLVPLLLEKLPMSVLVGCGGGGIIGTNEHNQVVEIEDNAALSLSVAQLPGVRVHPFSIVANDIPDLDSPPQAWQQLVGIAPEQQPQFILLSEPFISKINDLIAGLDFAYPSSVKIGGLASSSGINLPSALFYYSQAQPNQPHLLREGTVGLALSGNIVLDTIVAQGCRPIGQPYRISKGEQNVVLELASLDELSNDIRPPLDILRDLVQNLSEKDRLLAQNSLFIGIARDEFKLQLQQGDFLIRNLLGVDPRMGAIAIGDRVRPGQRIQFHLRDAQTSAEDLGLLLDSYQGIPDQQTEAAGVLMFSCLGRGEGLYGQPNFDSGLFRSYLPDLPIGGFFCNGEIGQVGGSTFLHGYTSAFAIIRSM